MSLLLATVPATASADVLVSGIGSKVACGRAVKPGVWYQSFSGGPRWARIAIKNHRGKVVWRRHVKATTHWRYWRFKGRCGSRYVLVYTVPGGSSRYRFRVRRR